MKVIIRADDVGYTNVHNMGTLKTLKEGFTTHCDLMLDCPGFEDACEMLKQFPWISVGWHVHFWGYPVSDPKDVPSLVDSDGRLKWRRINQCSHPVDGVVYEEALRECRAQLERCKKLLGKVPTTCATSTSPDVLGAAVRQACEEYGIAHSFMRGPGAGGEFIPDEKYRDLHIEEYFTCDVHPATPRLRVNLFDKYDPAAAIVDMPIREDLIYVHAEHPGYLDDFVLAEQHCTIHRVKDVEAFCDKRVYDWILKNKIELINQDDAVFGTSHYQDHLKEIDSPLWIGNMK